MPVTSVSCRYIPILEWHVLYLHNAFPLELIPSTPSSFLLLVLNSLKSRILFFSECRSQQTVLQMSLPPPALQTGFTEGSAHFANGLKIPSVNNIQVLFSSGGQSFGFSQLIIPKTDLPTAAFLLTVSRRHPPNGSKGPQGHSRL